MIVEAKIDLCSVNESINCGFKLTGIRALEYKKLKDSLKYSDEELNKRIFKRGVAKEFEYWVQNGTL